MSSAFYAHGQVIKWKNATGALVPGGTQLVIGALFGVVDADIGDGETGAVSVYGVHKLPKAAGVALAQGVKVGWDDGTKTVVAAGGSLPDFGYVYDDVAAADTIAPVIINR